MEMTEHKVQTALTAVKKVDEKLEEMKQTEDKKLKETEAKLNEKVDMVRFMCIFNVFHTVQVLKSVISGFDVENIA
jgi:hypothetical protein